MNEQGIELRNASLDRIIILAEALKENIDARVIVPNIYPTMSPKDVMADLAVILTLTKVLGAILNVMTELGPDETNPEGQPQGPDHDSGGSSGSE